MVGAGLVLAWPESGAVGAAYVVDPTQLNQLLGPPIGPESGPENRPK